MSDTSLHNTKKKIIYAKKIQLIKIFKSLTSTLGQIPLIQNLEQLSLLCLQKTCQEPNYVISQYVVCNEKIKIIAACGALSG